MALEASPSRIKRLKSQRRRESEGWKKRNGPVETRIDPSIIRPKPPRAPR